MLRQIVIFILLIMCSSLQAQQTEAIARGYYKFYKNGKTGLKDSIGNTILEANYNDIMSLDYSSFAKYKPLLYGIIKASVGKYINNAETTWKLFNTKGEALSDDSYIYVGVLSENLLKVGKGSMEDIGRNERYGLMNLKGKILIPIKYKSLELFHVDSSSKKAVFSAQLDAKNREFKLIDIQGKAINKDIYEELKQHEPLHKAKMKGKYGYINNEGKIVIPLIYDELYGFRGEVCLAIKDKLWGMINTKDKTVIAFEYQNIQLVSTGTSFGLLYAAQKNGLYGLIDESGKTILPHKYLHIGPYQLSLVYKKVVNQFRVKTTDNKLGVIDIETQEYIIPPDYDFFMKEIEQQQQMVILAQKGDKFGILDSNGQEKIAFEYQSLWRLEGSDLLLFRAKKGEYYGIIDGWTGKTVYPFIYNYVQTANAYPREYQLQLVQKDSIIYTYIDKKGEATRSLKQPNTNFGNSQIFAIINGQKKYAWRNFEGDTITNFYDVLHNFQLGYALCVSGKKLGILNRDGKLLLPNIYDDIQIPSESHCKYMMGNTYFAAKMNNKWGLVNIKNELIVAAQYGSAQEAWKNWKAH